MPRLQINGIDTKIGAAIRARRATREESQESLAKKLGITFQQLGKLERGANHTSLPRLLQIAEILGFDPVEFMSEVTGYKGQTEVSEHTTLLIEPGAIEVLRHWRTMSPKDRRAIIGLLRAMSKESHEAPEEAS